MAGESGWLWGGVQLEQPGPGHGHLAADSTPSHPGYGPLNIRQPLVKKTHEEL